MEIWYRRDFEDGYTFLFVASEDPGLREHDYEELAENMYNAARRIGACTSVVTLRNDDDEVVAVYGVVCDDCEPEGEGETILCKMRG